MIEPSYSNRAGQTVVTNTPSAYATHNAKAPNSRLPEGEAEPESPAIAYPSSSAVTSGFVGRSPQILPTLHHRHPGPLRSFARVLPRWPEIAEAIPLLPAAARSDRPARCPAGRLPLATQGNHPLPGPLRDVPSPWSRRKAVRPTRPAVPVPLAVPGQTQPYQVARPCDYSSRQILRRSIASSTLLGEGIPALFVPRDRAVKGGLSNPNCYT